ncbi:MAG: hypothetical protein JJ900_18790, partial [Rhodospirillales bacterium]|nr:hypothetical protein [Rhodospirillales bacterium]
MDQYNNFLGREAARELGLLSLLNPFVDPEHLGDVAESIVRSGVAIISPFGERSGIVSDIISSGVSFPEFYAETSGIISVRGAIVDIFDPRGPNQEGWLQTRQVTYFAPAVSVAPSARPTGLALDPRGHNQWNLPEDDAVITPTSYSSDNNDNNNDDDNNDDDNNNNTRKSHDTRGKDQWDL